MVVQGLIQNTGIRHELLNKTHAGTEAISNISINTIANKKLAINMSNRIDSPIWSTSITRLTEHNTGKVRKLS